MHTHPPANLATTAGEKKIPGETLHSNLLTVQFFMVTKIAELSVLQVKEVLNL
jgi:hypothetical protein